MRVTEKGQVTTPIARRKRYGLQKDVEVEFEFVPEAEGIRIKKRRAGAANPIRSLRGIVKKRIKVYQYIEDIRSR